MKRKLFFASVALAAVLVGCSKEEFTNVDNQLQELGDRPMVEAPVVTVGGAETKMTTSNNYADVKWQAGDGFGAAVMDVYNPDGEDFDEKFTIVDYINSNVLFATEDGSNFYAKASMPEGNHLFYAPFNKENISRDALATQMPLEQVVANPSSNATAPSNDIIKAFYEDGTNPVFVAYEKIYGEAKTTLDLQMRHIYSLPLVTLKLGDKVQVVDENGVHNQIEVEVNGEKKKQDVYESKITINKIVFTNEIQWKGSIVNENIATLLAKDEDNEVNPDALVWDRAQYEDAKTSDIVKFDALDSDEVENIVVKFDGGQELTADKNGYFFMILPADTYTKDGGLLTVKVYATINGKQYESRVLIESDKLIQPEKDVHLLPGLPYSADEYNADGTMKNSKGTSMTYTIDGHFVATNAPVAEYTTISNYNELVTFVTDVAYRGEALEELTAADAKAMLKNDTYDPKKYFVITATKNAPIVLDSNFVKTFKNACVIKGDKTPANISFLSRLATNVNLALGNIVWNDEASTLFSLAGDNVYTKGNVVVDLKEGAALPTINNTMAGVTIDLKGDVAATVVNKANAIVNINSAAAHDVTSTAGTVNVLVSTSATVTNGVAISSNGKTFVSKSTLNIADGVTETGDITNSFGRTKNTVNGEDVYVPYYAEANVNSAIVTITNTGKVTVNSDKAKLTVTGNGSVDNTIGGVVYNSVSDPNTVYATVSTFKDLDEIYDELCGLNKLVVTGSVENCFRSYDNAGTLILPQTGWAKDINTIDFNTGSSLAMGNGDWNWTGIQININDNVTWMGRDASVSTITVNPGNIKVANKKKLNIVDINVFGYQVVASTDDQLETALINGGNVTLAADINISDVTLDVPTTLDLNGKTLEGSILANANLEVKNGTIKSTNDDRSGIEVKGTSTLTLDNVNIESTRHALRVESTGLVEIYGGEYKVTGGTHNTTYALNIGEDDGTIDANVIVYGGKFIGPKDVATVDGGAPVCVQGNSKLTIKGGEFSGAKVLEGICVDPSPAKPTIVCEGGKFIDFNPACNNAANSFVPKGYTVKVERLNPNGTVKADVTGTEVGNTGKNYEETAYNTSWTYSYAYKVAKVVAAE